MTPPALLVLSGQELWIVAGIIVLLFGASKLPQLARSLGTAQKEYEKAKIEADQELREIRDGEGGERSLEELQRAADALGLETEGRSADELRRAIAEETAGES